MAINSSNYTACVNFAATACCLVKRRLTVDHSGILAPCHSIIAYWLSATRIQSDLMYARYL
jgi:hypothetical protein